jgi:hypothetical protein
MSRSSGAAITYVLTGDKEDALKAHLNQRVEITGRVQHASAARSTSSAPATGAQTGAAQPTTGSTEPPAPSSGTGSTAAAGSASGTASRAAAATETPELVVESFKALGEPCVAK